VSGKVGEAQLARRLEEGFREYHAEQGQDPSSSTDFGALSGVEFESVVAKLLREHGFEDVRGTPATGDQGADLLATDGGRLVVIQVKRYSAAVGNSAVQEVAAALRFYDGDEAWVITSSTFTPSARALAQKNGVRLIDGVALRALGER
jgi:restriction system protein